MMIGRKLNGEGKDRDDSRRKIETVWRKRENQEG